MTPSKPRSIRFFLLPVMLGLVLIIIFDVIDARVAQRGTTQLVANGMQSIQFANELRWDVHQLVAGSPDVPVQQLLAKIDRVVEQYAPLATFENENEIFSVVRERVAVLRQAEARLDKAQSLREVATISPLIDRLVELNLAEGKQIVKRVDALHTREIAMDGAIVFAVLILVTIVGQRFARAQTAHALLAKENFELIAAQNSELEAFAGRAAHDLRAPLNPIRGYAELIATDGAISAETRRLASNIGKGVGRMTRIIDDMLDLSRTGHVQPGQTDAEAAVRDALADVAADLEQAKVSCDVANVRVAVGSDALGQIVRNLVGNSVKYRSPERPLEIRIEGHIAGDKLIMSFADNGVGMDRETATHAFDAFYRGRRDIAGTGLGLAIVQRLAHSHHGECAIVVGRAVGTEVKLELPLAVD